MAVHIESLAEPLPGYRLIERLGGGGFGEVWKCEAPGGLHKAIKFVFGDLGAAGDDGHRAEQELKALSRVKTVRHPYILSLERYDIIDGQLMIVMELADRNLWDRFKECRAGGLPGIPREELLRYLEETAEALDLMNNEYQLQHLDIKPQNLFLVHNHVKVADFGLVKDLEGMQASMTGGVTPVYAAPETFDGWVSRFCDQYSLAIVYQELLTGQRPFSGANVRQLILQHMQTPPNVEPLPPADRPAIARSLSKTPGERFPTCRDLIETLKTGNRNAAVLIGNRATLPDSGPTSPSLVGHVPVATPQPTANFAGPLAGDPAALDAAWSIEGQEVDFAEPATACLRPRKDQSKTPKEEPISTDASSPSSLCIPPPKAPPEKKGDGVLLPALVIGVGHLGMTVVQRLRHELHQRFGGMEQLPHLRLMVLDTDPEVVRAATRGCGGTGDSTAKGGRFSESDVLLAPLNRPSHYLKPRDGRPDVDTWLPTRMLYRIPRSQVTTGVRALGRLAFWDNHRAIVRRLQSELDACMNPEALDTAANQTGLGFRGNRVRVYVVTSLAGGTGSGMFLDLAYTLRSLLKQAGYAQPDTVGLFLLPNVDRNRTRTLTLGNAFAALSELHYYARPGTAFTAQYHKREPALRDSDPPFARSIVLPLPDETDEQATRETIEEAGLFLMRDLCTPLGPAADLGRGGLPATPWEARGLYYQTFGLCQLSWPRQELIRTLAGRLCNRLIQRWMSKDSKPIRETVHSWVEEQWTRLQLSSSLLIERLGEMTGEMFGQDPVEAFRQIVEPFLERHAAAHRNNDETLFPPEEVAELLGQLEELIGTPQEDNLSESPASLIVSLREAADKLVQQWGQKLAELPVRLIEAPDFRLAGAEEANRQMAASIEQTLQNHEPLAHELTDRAARLYERLMKLVGPDLLRLSASGVLGKSSSRGRKKTALAEVQELLRGYPKTLYQSLLLRQAGNVFLTLRGNLADDLREINFCRLRLGELLHGFEEPAEATAAKTSAVKHLYPNGFADFKETAAHFGGQLNEEMLHELDTRMEAMFKKQFTALVNVCLARGNVLKSVESAMRQTAEEYLASRLGALNVADMFVGQYADEAVAASEIAGYFDEAAPQLPPSSPAQAGNPPRELCVLSAPSVPAGERLRALAAQALPEVEWQTASGDEDILFFRERGNLPLSQLPQLGPLAQEAYRQMSNADHFTPHCRSDIEFIKPEEPDV